MADVLVSGVRLSNNLLHGFKPRLRSAPPGALSAPPALRRRAPTDGQAGGHESITAERGPRSRQCLRRGIGRHRDGGGAATDCGSVGACAGSSHPVHRRPRQSRADAAQGVQVVRTVARSTWTPWTTPAPRSVGRRRTGWELRRDDAAMADESRRSLSELRQGETVRATITSHQPWGLMAELNDYEPVGASLDLIRRKSEPGVKRLAQELPPVGMTIDLVISEVRTWHRKPWTWVDLTAPGHNAS